MPVRIAGAPKFHMEADAFQKESDLCQALKISGAIQACTLPKFNSEFTPEKLPGPKRKGLSSNHHFSGENSMLKLQGLPKIPSISRWFYPAMRWVAKIFRRMEDWHGSPIVGCV